MVTGSPSTSSQAPCVRPRRVSHPGGRSLAEASTRASTVVGSSIHPYNLAAVLWLRRASGRHRVTAMQRSNQVGSSWQKTPGRMRWKRRRIVVADIPAASKSESEETRGVSMS
ncbi:hypothetical protein ASG64_17270 [Rhodococcus sp. Leaf247]|nr:hypothetical protein ASG64_17270 [Rhodococcus sp. Leaf247]